MHLDDELDWTLLARYFAGDASEAERAAIARWAAAKPERSAELTALQRWWESAATLPSESRVDAMWDGLSQRMRASGDGSGPQSARPFPARELPMPRRGTPVLSLESARGPTRKSWRRVVGAIAAAAVISVGGALAWQARSSPRVIASEQPAPREFSTARGQRATVRLEDGTRVELGFASTLRVRAFTRDRRELTLEGEAVFDVTHDPRRPFVVEAANAITEDLGTTFVISAYARDDAVRVVVVAGRVAVRPKHATANMSTTGVVLGSGELAHVGAAGRVDVVSHVATDGYVAWLSGRISFQNARVADVAADLERRFDVAIRIPDPSVAARRVTLDMPARTLDEVLDAVTVPLGLRHHRVDGAVVLDR